MKATWWIVLTILTILVSANAGAVVLSGPLEGVPESRGLLVWGDGHNDLFQQWSAFHPDHGAWFYGSSYGTSNADVYFFPSLTDPTAIDDASNFPYATGPILAQEGGTVFFRGVNGYYGAWVIEDVYPTEPSSSGPLTSRTPVALLDGVWYFQDDGSADLSRGSGPQPREWPIAHGGNGHFYELVVCESDTDSWLEDFQSSMELTHRGLAGHLATITSAEEYQWILEHMLSRAQMNQTQVFLGGWNDGFVGGEPAPPNSYYPMGNWHWITGETWDFTAWAQYAPYVVGGLSFQFSLMLQYADFNTGMVNSVFEYSTDYWTMCHLVEYDSLPVVDVPPLDHPVPVEATSWGNVKALFR